MGREGDVKGMGVGCGRGAGEVWVGCGWSAGGVRKNYLKIVGVLFGGVDYCAYICSVGVGIERVRGREWGYL